MFPKTAAAGCAARARAVPRSAAQGPGGARRRRTRARPIRRSARKAPATQVAVVVPRGLLEGRRVRSALRRRALQNPLHVDAEALRDLAGTGGAAVALAQL